MKFKIIIADNNTPQRQSLSLPLAAMGYKVLETDNGKSLLAASEEHGPFDFAIIDNDLPDLDALRILEDLKQQSPTTKCIVTTSISKVQEAVAAIKNGALDYMQKPVNRDHLTKILLAAVQEGSMQEISQQSAPKLSFRKGRHMIGESPAISKVFEVIQKLAKVDTSVLIRGESGTGKELVAQALHANSPRAKGPFVAVNCGAIPENLIESELFGHEKGTFTGADRRKIGKFQFANGGTIFLDEIGDISAQMQVKLLRVLQEKKFTPVGSNQEIEANVRIVSATNRPLEDMIKKNTFREDLFYRLNILPINLPPLRERREDLPSLCRFMIAKFNEIHNRNITSISNEASHALKAYSWPGNIRELENVIEHAFIIETTDCLQISSLPQNIQACAPLTFVTPETEDADNAPPNQIRNNGIITDFSDLKYPALKERFEKEFIVRALTTYGGRINLTAEQTQMTKVTLLRKLEKYKIDPKDFK